MPLLLTLSVAKIAAWLSRGFGKGGGQALPGLIAERFDPHVGAALSSRLEAGVILVTGTNGKTTTTRLIGEMLEAQSLRVVSNRSGSNLKRGVVSALIRAANLRGEISAEVGLFEVDEASLRRVTPDVKPTHIVITNLFRDQLDRYGELDATARLIGEGMAGTGAQLYLNADDPLVASLAQYAEDPKRVHFFGVEGAHVSAVGEHHTAIDSDRCPICRTRLEFSRIFYGHIGHYRCPKGDFARPKPEVVVTNVEMADRSGSRFVLAIAGKRATYQFSLPGTYNLYNALAAVSIGQAMHVPVEKMQATLAATEAAFGRVERVEVDGRVLCLLLIKNPAGFTQVLQTFVVGREAVRAMFVVNDLAADGRDVSWLWDVPLEALVGSSPTILTAGIRGADMALRLHYAGVEAESVRDIKSGIEKLLKETPAGETAYILPTYTAMLEVRKVLAERVPMKGMS